MSDSILTRTQQELGAYYTPPDLAQIITDWAITSGDDTVLDPSYGECAFLAAALKTLSSYQVVCPGKQIWGIDIDPRVNHHPRQLISAGAEPHQFLTKNFFETTLSDLGGVPFPAIVGNAPYVNYHNIEPAEQKLAQKRMIEYGHTVSGRVSYWAYFILYALEFLRKGGRMGMVLPCSFVRADYAAEIRRILSSRFRRVHIILIRERLFEKTDEQALLCLAEGFEEHTEQNNIAIYEVENVKGLASKISKLCEEPSKLLAPSDNLYSSLISDQAQGLITRLTNHNSVIRLGDWVTIRIGVVTGSNSYFIRSQTSWQKETITSDFTKAIIRHPAEMKGLFLTDADVNTLVKADKSNLLLSLDENGELPQEVRNYIANAPVSVQNATKCAERSPWYVVPHRFAPSAFAQYMSADWPRLVVNQSQATCTNNIHRLRWTEERPNEDWTRLALGALSSLSQLSAELIGRSYGGGVLKLEPRELSQLLVPTTDKLDQDVVEHVDKLLREGRREETSKYIDQHILIDNLSLTSAEVASICEARDRLYLRRHG